VVPLPPDKNKCLGQQDALSYLYHPNDNVEWVNAGLEYAVAETFFLRSGVTTLFREDSEEGLTFGGGINYRVGGSSTLLKVDYSYSAFGRLKNVQRLSLGLRF
jgi:hypothetical protein